MKKQVRRGVFETNSSSTQEYETFEKSYVGKNGEKVIAFGYYGYN